MHELCTVNYFLERDIDFIIKWKNKNPVALARSIKPALIRKGSWNKLFWILSNHRGHSAVLQNIKFSIRRYCSNPAFFIWRKADCRSDIRNNGLNMKPVIYFYKGKFRGSSNVIESIFCFSNRAYWIRRKTFPFCKYAYNFFIDYNRKSVIICSYNKAAIIINIKTAYGLNGIVLIHKAEFFSVVTVKSGISTNPQNSIVGTGNIICFTARKTICVVINCSDIRVEFFCRSKSLLRLSTKEQKHKNHKRHGFRPAVQYMFAFYFLNYKEARKLWLNQPV